MKKADIMNFALTFLGAVATGLAILMTYDYIQKRKAEKAAGEVA